MKKPTAGTNRIDPPTIDLLVGVPARLNRLIAVILYDHEPRLTFRQYRTLARVAGGYTSLRQLADRSNLSLATVSENVDGLVRRGLMTTTQSASDRRAIVLAVTDSGRDAVERADEAMQHLFEWLVDEIPDGEMTAVTNALQSMYDRATTYFEQTGVGRDQ